MIIDLKLYKPSPEEEYFLTRLGMNILTRQAPMIERNIFGFFERTNLNASISLYSLNVPIYYGCIEEEEKPKYPIPERAIISVTESPNSHLVTYNGFKIFSTVREPLSWFSNSCVNERIECSSFNLSNLALALDENKRLLGEIQLQPTGYQHNQRVIDSNQRRVDTYIRSQPLEQEQEEQKNINACSLS